MLVCVAWGQGVTECCLGLCCLGTGSDRVLSWFVLLGDRECQCVVLVCVAKGQGVTAHCVGLCC